MDKIILKKEFLEIRKNILYYESINYDDLSIEELEKLLYSQSENLIRMKNLKANGVKLENKEHYDKFLKLLSEEKYEELIKYEII